MSKLIRSLAALAPLVFVACAGSAPASSTPRAVADAPTARGGGPAPVDEATFASDEKKADEAAAACDDEGAEAALTDLASFALDDTKIGARFDAVKARVHRNLESCHAKALDDAIATAESAWDWPALFTRLGDETAVPAKGVAARRTAAIERLGRFLDGTLVSIVSAGSAAKATGDHHDAWLRDIDPASYPTDVAPFVTSRAKKIAGVMLVFDRMQDPKIYDAPPLWVTLGGPKVRTTAAPTEEGRELPDGVEFDVVARGKLDGVELLVAGSKDGDVIGRLASAKFLIPANRAIPAVARIEAAKN